MFRKFDQWVDRAMDKKWVRILVFSALILNGLLSIVGVIALALAFG